MTDTSGGVPPSRRRRVTRTDHRLHTEFPCAGWAEGVLGYSHKAPDWVQRGGAAPEDHDTASRKSGSSVVESNTWETPTHRDQPIIVAVREQQPGHFSLHVLAPKSTVGSTLTDLHPSWSLRSIRATGPLPPLAEPPVSRTCPGLTEVEAIPSPSVSTGTGRTLRAAGLQDGPIEAAGGLDTKQIKRNIKRYE